MVQTKAPVLAFDRGCSCTSCALATTSSLPTLPLAVSLCEILDWSDLACVIHVGALESHRSRLI